jgi:hypothetical protein
MFFLYFFSHCTRDSFHFLSNGYDQFVYKQTLRLVGSLKRTFLVLFLYQIIGILVDHGSIVPI